MATITSTQSGDYHTGSTWVGGAVPSTTDRVVIALSHVVTFSGTLECGNSVRSTTGSTQAAAQMFIIGTLKASRTTNWDLKVKGQIQIKWNALITEGVLDLGSDLDPMPEGTKGTLHTNAEGSTRNYSYTMYSTYAGSKMAKFYMVSAQYRERNTWLIGQVSAGSSTFTVNDATGWLPGDEIILAPKHTTNVNSYLDYDYDNVVIQSITGNVITTVAPLTFDHGYLLAEDYEAAGASNRTSNLKISGFDNSTSAFCIYLRRAVYDVRNVEFAYANNFHNVNAAVFRPEIGGIYGLARLENCSMWSDCTGKNKHAECMYYSGSTKESAIIRNNAFIQKAKSGYRARAPIYNYYGGQTIVVENCNFYGENRYLDAGFISYQQLATYKHCKTFNAHYFANLHNNSSITGTENGWAVGCLTIATGLNAKSYHTDVHIRFCGSLAASGGGWINEIVFNRTHYRQEHLRYDENHEHHVTVNSMGSTVTGSKITLIDGRNDVLVQRVYNRFGRQWQENTELRNAPFSTGMWCTKAGGSETFKQVVPALQGQSLPISAYIKNVSGSPFIGDITLRIVQSGQTLATAVVDATTLTNDQWNFVSITGLSLLNKPAELQIEIVDLGSKIYITDVLLPPSPNEVSQANATKIALEASGGYLNLIKILTDKLDQMIEADSGDYRFDTKSLEQVPSGGSSYDDTILIGKVDALQSDLNNPNQFKADISSLPTTGYDDTILIGKIDDLQSDLNNPNQFKADISSLPTTGYDDSILVGKVDSIQADLNNPDQFKADISSLPTTSYDDTTLISKVDALQSDLNNPDQFKADVSSLSTFDPTTDVVANVNLVATTTTNTDMRGTDNATTSNADVIAEIGLLNNLTAAEVWNSVNRSLTDKSGFSLSTADKAAIATAVETAILNEGDGTQVLNAIVGAIGNSNIDEVALVAAIRADLERASGMIDNIPTLPEIEASTNIGSSSYDDTALVAKIDTIDSVSDQIKIKVDTLSNPDLTPLATTAEVSASENAIIAAMPVPEKMSTAELHTSLDSYTNKDDWKSDPTNLSTVLSAISALNDIDLASIEASSVLAKEATVNTVVTNIAAIPTTDSVADLAPVINAISALDDSTVAQIVAGLQAVSDDFKADTTAVSGAINLILKYHDNKVVFFGSDGTTQTTQSEAYFMNIYDNDGITLLKSISFKDALGAPSTLPLSTNYTKV